MKMPPGKWRPFCLGLNVLKCVKLFIPSLSTRANTIFVIHLEPNRVSQTSSALKTSSCSSFVESPPGSQPRAVSPCPVPTTGRTLPRPPRDLQGPPTCWGRGAAGPWRTVWGGGPCVRGPWSSDPARAGTWGRTPWRAWPGRPLLSIAWTTRRTCNEARYQLGKLIH